MPRRSFGDHPGRSPPMTVTTARGLPGRRALLAPVPEQLSNSAARRRAAAVAGHTGDEKTAREALADPASEVRASALGALARMGASGGQ